MKTIKILTTILILIILGTLVWAAFLPSTIYIKQSTTIKAPIAVVYDEVNNFRNWDHWSPYKDSSLLSEFEGPNQGVGARVIWNDKRHGRAVMEIVEANQYSVIMTRMETPNQDKSADMIFSFEQKGGSTKVSWERTIDDLAFPFGRFVGYMLEKGYNFNFKDGLRNLKEYIETHKSEAEYYGYEIIIEEYSGGNFLAVYDSCLADDMKQHIEDNYNAIREYASQLGIKPIGVNMIQWHTYNPDDYSTFTCMIPYDINSAASSGSVVFYSIPAYSIAKVRHEGSYEASYNAWVALENYQMFHSLKTAGDPWEEYIVDASMVSDSTKLVTNICFPFK